MKRLLLAAVAGCCLAAACCLGRWAMDAEPAPREYETQQCRSCPNGQCQNQPWQPTQITAQAPATEPIPEFIVLVLAGDERGTGFFTDFGVITANHAVRLRPLAIVTQDGHKYPATVTWKDAKHDIAVLTGAPRPRITAVLATETSSVGETLYWGGACHGTFSAYKTNSGAVTQFVDASPLDTKKFLSRPGFDMLEISGTLPNGVSGGPVWNAQGHVVGVVSGSDGTITIAGYLAKTGLPAACKPAGPTPAQPTAPVAETPGTIVVPPSLPPPPVPTIPDVIGLPALADRVAALEKKTDEVLSVIATWPIPRDGKDGTNGKDGTPGIGPSEAADLRIGFDHLNLRIAALEAAIAKPIQVVGVDKAGTPYGPPVSVNLGDTLKLQAVLADLPATPTTQPPAVAAQAAGQATAP